MTVILTKSLQINPIYFGEILSIQLGLKDEEGNTLVLYRDGYNKLHTLEQQIVDFIKKAENSLEDKVHLLSCCQVSLIKFFSQENQERYRVQNKSIDEVASPNHPHCIIVKNGKVYIHPKIPSNITTIGMQHSSLFHGNNVDFAGTLLKDVMTDRWILSNTTGHYQTRASKISSCLRALIANGIPIDALDLEYWILMDRDNPHKTESYTIKGISAKKLLEKAAKLSFQKPIAKDPSPLETVA